MRRVGLVSARRFVDPFVGDDRALPLDRALPDDTWVEVQRGPDRAVTSRVLAEPGSALAAMYALAAAHGLDPVHPEACEREAAALVARPGLDDPALRDLTGLPFVTIDYETSRDLDQAVHVARAADGWTVWYALADGAYHVRPGTALFDEALRRGTTAYLPGLIVPMLPLALCEGVMSLNPRVDRRALVMRLSVDRHGRCTDAELSFARVRSRDKLSYARVQALYDGGPSPTADPDATAGLHALAEVGEALLAEAEARDVVQYRRREIDVHLGDAGLRFLTTAGARLDSERYNEQISLLANTAGARWLAARAGRDPELHPIYRVHAAPDRRELEQLADRLAQLAALHGLRGRTWSWDPDHQSLADFVRRLPLDGPHAAVARALQRQVLVTSGPSGYQADPERHHGVGADAYARFTAPMREVIGCFLHKEVAEGLGLRPPRPRAEDEAHREAIIAIAQRSRARSRALVREVNQQVLDRLFRADLAATPPWRDGTLLGAGPSRLYVQLDDPAVDVHVYTSHLPHPDGLAVDRATTRVTRDGQRWLAVGDRVRVRVTGHDDARDRWRLEVERLA